MLFNSITFLFIFLPLTLAVYYLVPPKGKHIVMLIASLLFYAWGEPVYIILMLLSILLNYFCGLDIAYKADQPVKVKRSLIFAIVLNLLILGFFKYYGFVIETVNAVFPVEIPYRVLSLPIGISFYTFQAMSYLIDIYRQEIKPQRNILYFALYISMFPQLIAGPIVRYADIEEQLVRIKLSADKFGQGVTYFICGLAKKVILADMAGNLYQEVAAMQPGTFSVLTAWAGCIAYAFQIYFDFSGYSDMALGLGKMFGFEFRRNFHYPYTSKSITEFWRRWHISLSTWFREYVYFPLGGNQCGISRHMFNLLLVWILIGLWHGASWHYVLWGVWFGAVLVLEKYVWGESLERLPDAVQHVYTYLVVLIGWVFFFSPTVGEAMDYLGVMFGAGASALIDQQGLFLVLTHWLLLLLCTIGSSVKGQMVIRAVTEIPRQRKWQSAAACVVYIGIFFISVAFLVTNAAQPFLYFRF